MSQRGNDHPPPTRTSLKDLRLRNSVVVINEARNRMGTFAVPQLGPQGTHDIENTAYIDSSQNEMNQFQVLAEQSNNPPAQSGPSSPREILAGIEVLEQTDDSISPDQLLFLVGSRQYHCLRDRVISQADTVNILLRRYPGNQVRVHGIEPEVFAEVLNYLNNNDAPLRLDQFEEEDIKEAALRLGIIGLLQRNDWFSK